MEPVTLLTLVTRGLSLALSLSIEGEISEIGVHFRHYQLPPVVRSSTSAGPYYDKALSEFQWFFSRPARGNANGISEIIKQKEKRGCYCARCLCTRHIFF